MKDWPAFSTEDELERADSLLHQADALLGRRRDQAADQTAAALDSEDDLPILTDIVDEQALAELWPAPELTAELTAELSPELLPAPAPPAPLPADAASVVPSPTARPDREQTEFDPPLPDAEAQRSMVSSPLPPAAPLSASSAAAPEAIEAEAGETAASAATDGLATPAESTASAAPPDAQAFTEALIELDTEIARSIEDWMEREFPQFLERELASMRVRLHRQLHEHLNATLLGEISAHISRHLGRSVVIAPAPTRPHDDEA